jgi:hypothetical protein
MYQYTVKVLRSNASDKTYLWGGAGITHVFNSPLCLTIRVMEMNEEIKISIDKGKGSPEPIGSLKEREIFTIPLNGIRGIFATCENDSKVECYIDNAQGSSFIPSLSKP